MIIPSGFMNQVFDQDLSIIVPMFNVWHFFVNYLFI